jgi:hypothetical protein
MTMDDAHLSEHEQRVLEEMERNLLQEDSEFVKRVREATPRRESIRLLRLSILGLVVGLGLMLAFTVSLGLGILGFLLMLASTVGIGVAVRNLASGGRAPGAAFRDALRRAESRIRERRSKS